MMRSMFAGVSGLRNHQTRMDVIGNNIANVNTIGYKKARVTFQDILSQNIRGASSPTATRGGTNPMQVGLGMTINTIDTIHTQGSSETTGKVTDMMVDGDGFFIVGDGTNRFYTRAGNFDFDAVGNLINTSGLLVQGWMADSQGNIDTTVAISGIKIPKGQSIQPKATENATFVNNLDAGTPQYDNTVTPPVGVVATTLEIYDSLGNAYNLPIEFRKTANSNEWSVVVDPQGTFTAATLAVTTTSNLIFDGNGNYKAGDLTIDLTNFTNGANDQSIKVDLTKITQYAGESNVEPNFQDGYASGVLNGYAIDSSGVITGQFSNGLTKQLAQVALANFNNPAGLMKVGGNLFTQSNNSGNAQIGAAGTGGRGEISPGKLEMSNVDLSQEFTDMIITQRGFQANSRIITVSDEMLQELVNLKR